MDRQIVYPGQIPLETDLLNTNRNTMIALGKIAAAIFGTGGIVNGLAVGPTSPASLSVSVGAGEIYQLANVDDTAYSSLPADTTDTVVKQGIQLQPVTLSCPAPSTSGFSINYLIEAKFQSSDTGSVVLPYYNASNPQQAYSGPGNSGAAQAVTRAGTVSLQAKAGIAATSGTQTTPAVDAGYIALAVVTVANGQATITAGNIVAMTNGQVLSSPISSGRLINVQTFTSSGTFTPNPAATKTIVEALGGGGAGGSCAATGSTTVAAAAGGWCGAYIKAFITGAISGTVACTIGAGGSPGAGGINNGGTGGTTSFGSLVTAPGGLGGTGVAAATPPCAFPGNSGSVSLPTTTGMTIVAMGTASGGAGMSFGGGASQTIPGGGQSGAYGFPGSGVGAGGAGASVAPLSGNASGQAGRAGLIIVWEYA